MGKVDFRRKRRAPEQKFQAALVRDLRKLLPHDCFMTAFPAGGGGRLRGAILNGMGLVAGMPDLLFIYRGETSGMELKAKDGVLSEAQIETHAKLALAGVDVRVVRDFDDALVCLKEWEIPTRILGDWIVRRNAAKAAA